jgi:hypothetical protein
LFFNTSVLQYFNEKNEINWKGNLNVVVKETPIFDSGHAHQLFDNQPPHPLQKKLVWGFRSMQSIGKASQRCPFLYGHPHVK